MTGTDTDELMSLERAGWAALSRGEGPAFYATMFADDAIVVVPGALLDKSRTLASWDGVTPWQRYDLVERRVTPLGDDAAVVVYEATAARPGEPPYRAIICSTYVRRPEGWRLLVHQQTPQV
ncbi:nuclear transport factor 2 family protein [Nucisporomicrobium flavum]|uniref:nuclear transport factor 2 family protein n=1 Tax=Nucisporomicrobium flavum TaxID=2785915 RepID=UPI0018F48382|nr:nuclear transport factor 2 family protein [Nucisporomicrobium flavum]